MCGKYRNIACQTAGPAARTAVVPNDNGFCPIICGMLMGDSLRQSFDGGVYQRRSLPTAQSTETGKFRVDVPGGVFPRDRRGNAVTPGWLPLSLCGPGFPWNVYVSPVVTPAGTVAIGVDDGC